jgi:hypothetical protein
LSARRGEARSARSRAEEQMREMSVMAGSAAALMGRLLERKAWDTGDVTIGTWTPSKWQTWY